MGLAKVLLPIFVNAYPPSACFSKSQAIVSPVDVIISQVLLVISTFVIVKLSSCAI
jgi:hypothetical protein